MDLYTEATNKEQLVSMKNADSMFSSCKNYLGEEDAETEWNQNAEEAEKKFLFTTAYEEFEDTSNIILIGRTGTGKTAILRYLEHKIEKGKLKEYKYAIKINFNDIILCLNNFQGIDNSIHSKIEVERSIKFIITISIMQFISNIQKEELYKIKTFLKKGKFDDHSSIYTKIKKAIERSQDFSGKLGNTARNINTLYDIIEIFTTAEYNDALIELHNFTKLNKIVVLIDSSNEYDIRDLKTMVIIKSLIAICFEFYSEKKGIVLKIALPSEIHTHLFNALPGKHQGHTVTIQWNYKDLIRFIAIRIFRWSVKEEVQLFHFINEFSIKDFTSGTEEANENAKCLIGNILPEICPTSLDFSFDTIAYCIRHTLKKPRELMSIFNSLIEQIIKTKNIKLYYENPEKIKLVIHSTQEGMICSALSMYHNFYIDIGPICDIVLSNQTYCFKASDIEDAMKKAAGEVRRIIRMNPDSLIYDKQDIQRILLESGLVGKVIDYKVIAKGHPKFNNESEITLITAQFEYQIKGRLSFNVNDLYVIHPMCYEHYTCKLHKKVLVYPDKASDEGDIICNIMGRG